MVTRPARLLAAILAGLALLHAGSAAADARARTVKAPSAVRVSEGSVLRVVVTLPRKARARTAVKWSLPAAADFSRTKGSLVFAKGRKAATLRIATKQDAAREATEAHTLKIGRRVVRVTLVDDDRAPAASAPAPSAPQPQPAPAPSQPAPPSTTPGPTAPAAPLPTVSIQDLTRAEGSADKQQPEVTLSAKSASDVVVRVETSDGTAAAGSDYSKLSLDVTIKAGATKALVPTQIVSDNTDEPQEAFKLTLSSPRNATIADGEGTVFITDDDDAPVLNVGDGAPRLENNTNMPFTVSLSRPSSSTITVKVSTLAGTAGGGATCGPGVDFVMVSGQTVSFAPNETSKSVNVGLCEDTIDEVDETFKLTAFDLSAGATMGDSQGTGTIDQDED